MLDAQPRRRPATRFLLLVAATALLAACAHQPGVGPLMKAPGFWHGLLHGAIVPFSFVGSLFTEVRIYAWPNSGVWYDLGFLVGIGIWGGAGRAASRRR
jgi:hypothetical protein